MINLSDMSNISEAAKKLGSLIAVRSVVLCAAIILAAACTGSATSYREATSPDAASVPASATSTAPSAAGEDSGDGSPLLALLGLPHNNSDAIDDYYQELYAQAEHQITECMVAQGFEYTPFDYSQIDPTADEAIVDSRAYAEEHGFGITSLEDPVPEGLIQEFEDPNADYVSSLTAGEQDAFYQALHGQPDSGSEVGGCHGQAFEDAFGFFAVFEEFGFDYEEIVDATNADPRIVEATSQWSVCMAQSGYLFADKADAKADIQYRLEDLLSDPSAFAGDNLRTGAQRQIDQLAAMERAIAVAAWECDTPVRELKRTVEREYEQRFADEHGVAIRQSLGS